ncbi:eL24 family ribosomal protein [Caulifigura coniformis]|nr:hypothetical protein [Caulifigura coniformis]
MMATRYRRWTCGAFATALTLTTASFGQDAAAPKPPAAPPAPKGAPIPQTPEFASPDIKPTFCDWLLARPVALAKKLNRTDPLQRPPFAGAPTDSLKGMAAGIRAVQLDAPNRVAAAAYLGTVDCATYPQAQEMLIAVMNEDPQEEVRYEAVMALRMMLTRGCANLDTECECESCENKKEIAAASEKHSKEHQRALIKDAKGPAKAEARDAKRKNEVQEKRYDCCRGCCNAKVLNALAKVAYEKDGACCFVEPSERVREAAKEGLCLCCTVPGWTMHSPEPPVAPADEPEKTPGETPAPDDKEVKPPQLEESVPKLTPPPEGSAEGPVTQTMATKSSMSGTPLRPAIPGLKGYCVMELRDRKFVAAKPEFSSTFDGRTYYFSSKEKKAAFDAEPERFGLAYRGYDPVVWQTKREMVDGQFLREYQGQFYLFAAKENWDKFKAAPQKFVLRDRVTTGQSVVSR